MLERLAHAGMDIVRLNMSHSDHDSAREVIRSIKTLNRKVTYPIAVMLDTQGPEIRPGDLANELELKNGSVITVNVRGDVDVEASSFYINSDELIDAVDVGAAGGALPERGRLVVVDSGAAEERSAAPPRRSGGWGTPSPST